MERGILKEYYVEYLEEEDLMSKLIYAHTAREAIHFFKESNKKELEIISVIEFVSGRTQIKHEVLNNNIVSN